MPAKHILLTGISGVIGRYVSRELIQRGHHLRGFDIRPPHETLPDLDMQIGDLADRPAVDKAVAGVDSIIHLAAFPDEADFMTVLVPANVIGTYNVLESARQHGVQRVVITSSGQTVQGLDWRTRTVSTIEPPSPLTHYAVTKVLAEAWARYYADQHGMSVIVVRPGGVPRNQEQIDQLARNEVEQRIYLAPDDAGRFYALCVEAEDVPFAVLFATSRPNGPAAFDLEPARHIIGYEPQQSYPDGIN